MNFATLARPAVLTMALASLNAAPSLTGAWMDAPMERWIWPLFLLWLVPCFTGRGRAGEPGTAVPPYPVVNRKLPSWLSAMALVSLLGGALLEMNLFRHLALALAISGVVFRSGWGFWLWLAAVAWLPAAGWLTAMWPMPQQLTIRYLTCTAGTVAFLFSQASSKSTPSPA